MNLFRKLVLASVFGVLGAANLFAQGRAPAATRLTQQNGVAGSMILENADAVNNVKRLPVLRSYTLTDMRRQSSLRFGDRQIDLKPFLENQRAIPNVAARLQAVPQLVKMRGTVSTVSEVQQGVVIESDLQYSFTAGACHDTASRNNISSLGIHCPERASVPDRGVSQLDRAVPLSHLSPSVTTENRARYATYYRQQDALVQQHIAAFRAALKDPRKKAQLVAAVGQAKADEIGALTDDQIKDNIASAGVQHMHETIFVPRTYTKKLPPGVLALGAQPAQPKNAAPAVVSAGQTPDQTLGPDIYLTGFTLGHEYEWQITYSFDIDPCVLGLDAITDDLASVASSLFGISPCPMHASVTPYAFFNYGLGLRFPIKTTMQYHNQTSGKSTASSVRVDFAPFDGSAADYAQAGLSSDKLFEGHEVVAQIGAGAGIKYDLPILGAHNAGVEIPYLNLVSYLPAPFSTGNFIPPAPGQVLNSGPIFITQVDLFANLFDLATLQATLSPAVEVGIRSHGLSFELDDEKFVGKIAGQNATMRPTMLSRSGMTVPISSDAKDHSTDFLITNPVYNVGLEITPGIVLNLGIDLGVWSQSWNPAIWIPQLAVDIPSQGINFSCHDGTVCTHEYKQSSQGKVVEASLAETVKSIQANGCNGPSNDTHTFFCRNLPGWTNCINQAKLFPSNWHCGLDSEDSLNQILRSLDCPAGLCTRIRTQPTIFCPSGVPGSCGGETTLQACNRVVTDEGMRVFGYQRCCDRTSDPQGRMCSTGWAPPPAPPVRQTVPNGPGSAVPLPSSQPAPQHPGTVNPREPMLTPAKPATGPAVPVTPAPATIAPKPTPAAQTPAPAGAKTSPATTPPRPAASKPGTNPATKPADPQKPQ